MRTGALTRTFTYAIVDGEAAKAFVEAGNCYQEKGIDSKHEAATQWVAAAQMFKKAEPPSKHAVHLCLS